VREGDGRFVLDSRQGEELNEPVFAQAKEVVNALILLVDNSPRRSEWIRDPALAQMILKVTYLGSSALNPFFRCERKVEA